MIKEEWIIQAEITAEDHARLFVKRMLNLAARENIDDRWFIDKIIYYIKKEYKKNYEEEAE